MAFQTGTKVDPRLMRADLSGFSRGTELAMAGIGAAIKGYATKKKENEQINLAAETLAGQAKDNPYVRGLFGISEEEAENVTAADFKPGIKAYGGAKAAMALSAQINLLTTKAAVEGQSLKAARERLGGFTEAIKDLGMEVVRGQLQFVEKPVGGKKKISYEDTLTNPQLQKIFNLYQEEAQSIFPGQFTPSTGFEPTKTRGGQNRYTQNFTTDQYFFEEGIEGSEYLNP
jgi:hypothetical protein